MNSARSTWPWPSRSPSARSARHCRPGLPGRADRRGRLAWYTAVADLIGGQTIGADEAQHLIAVAGAALLFWQARTIRSSAARTGSWTPSRAWDAPPPGREQAAGR